MEQEEEVGVRLEGLKCGAQTIYILCSASLFSSILSKNPTILLHIVQIKSLMY
jgi:hypothetical protein